MTPHHPKAQPPTAAPSARRRSKAAAGDRTALVVVNRPKKKPTPGAKPRHRRHIVARVNVGWGNSLYLRGEGGLLTWDLGVPMVCLGNDQWVWSFPHHRPPRKFKCLRNDREWSVGENLILRDGRITFCVPLFSPL